MTFRPVLEGNVCVKENCLFPHLSTSYQTIYKELLLPDHTTVCEGLCSCTLKLPLEQTTW